MTRHVIIKIYKKEIKTMNFTKSSEYLKRGYTNKCAEFKGYEEVVVCGNPIVSE